MTTQTTPVTPINVAPQGGEADASNIDNTKPELVFNFDPTQPIMDGRTHESIQNLDDPSLQMGQHVAPVEDLNKTQFSHSYVEPKGVNPNINVTPTTQPAVAPITTTSPNPSANTDLSATTPTTTTPVAPVIDPTTGQPVVQQPTTTDTTTDLYYKDYSPSAKYAIALEESGLSLFGVSQEEANAGQVQVQGDLKASDLVNSIKGYVNTQSDQVVTTKLKELGSIAEYVNFLYKEGDIEEIKPAIVNQRYADFDVEGANVTVDDLVNVITPMYVKQGLSQDKIDDLITLAKADPSNTKLKADAMLSKQFHQTYVNNLKTTAANNYRQNQINQQQIIEKQQNNFADQLRKGTILDQISINSAEAADLYAMQFNKNIPVRYKDEEGNDKTEYLTAYDVGIHQAVNDPAKLAMLTYLIKHDFNLSSLKGIVKQEINTNILTALDAAATGTPPEMMINQSGQVVQKPQGSQQISYTPVTSFSI